jgi:hypothetical protein
MRIRLVTSLLVAAAALPGAAHAQFGDYTFQAEVAIGTLLPGFNSIFSESQSGGGTREVKTQGAASLDGRFLILWPGGLHSGVSFALVPDVPLEETILGTRVGTARRLRLSVAMGGKTPKIPGTPVRFRGGFDFGFTRYSFSEASGSSLPLDKATNLVAAVSMGWDVELTRPVSLATDITMSFEDGQTQSLASFLVHVGLAVRLVER